MTRILTLCLLSLICINARAGNDGDSSEIQAAIWQKYVDSVKTALHYQTGTVQLANGIAKLNVPSKFKFLNKEQSRFVVEELWGNLPNDAILGTLFPVDTDPFTEGSFVFIVSYEALGYVNDEDAESIDYDEILKEMKTDQVESNKQRQAAGVATMEIVGWAAKPYYDKNNKTLHWAKNLKVEGAEENTLNYIVKVLGRNGILNLNAVSNINELASVQAVIPEVLKIPSFTDGNAYKDFDPKVDEVAAWTIGGLVAGKVLAKAGLFVLLLKFWKLILFGIVGIGAFIKKFVMGRKKSDEPGNDMNQGNAADAVNEPWPADESANVESGKEQATP
ncbi:MAG: DUF2167 domain-containing protein [Chitinophagaceae bacterium]|nr:MAG: DUF2167 domain-containing protein [Chitinophagaceae bacterium]